MSDYTVLADIGGSLIDLLWTEMHADPQVTGLIDNQFRISLQSPYELRNNNSARLSIYLYRIVENAYCKNQFPVAGTGLNVRRPPLTLDLYYLVTPLVGPPREQQIVLGKVMQVFYDRPILSGRDLTGGLAGADDGIRIALNPVSLEETTRVWHALEMSYRLSICYVVRVAFVDSTRERFNQPVVSQETIFGEGAAYA